MSSATTAMISPVLRGDSGAAMEAGAGPVAAAGRATLGAGVGCAGAAGRGGGADAAVDAALAGAAVHAGADAAPSTIPQWTQNFALGWFSLPHAVHFIDGSSHGNLDKALTGRCACNAGGFAPPKRAYYDPIIVRLSLHCDA